MEKCKLLGFTYSIKEVEEVSRGENLNGLIVYDDLTIYLNRNLPRELKKETLLHEVLHGISEALGLDFEEKTVQVLSRTLYSFIVENPVIFSFLASEQEQSPLQS